MVVPALMSVPEMRYGMTLSELISELQDALAIYGDKNVYVRDQFGQLELAVEVIEIGTIEMEESTVIAIES